MSDFQVVSKKVRKPKAPEIKELILVCRDAHDWPEGLDFVGEINSIKDLESFGEKKRLSWYFHGFSPSRKMIFTIIKGTKSEFPASSEYINMVINHSNASDAIKSQLQESSKQ